MQVSLSSTNLYRFPCYIIKKIKFFSLSFYRSISAKIQGQKNIPVDGLVRDGTPCGDQLVRKRKI